MSVPPETRRKPASRHARGQRGGVGQHALLIVDEFRLHGLQEADRLGGDDVHQRPALHAGEDRTCRWPAAYCSRQRMMPARGPRSVLWVVEVTMSAYWQGFGMDAGRHEAREVRHVDQQHGADRIRDLAHAAEIDDARIGAAAADDHLRPVLGGQRAPARRSRSARSRDCTP